MSLFIIFSGIAAFLFLLITIAVPLLMKRKLHLHKKLGYLTAAVATIHAAVALYKTYSIYFGE